MSPEQTAELDKWAAQSGERAAIEEFLQMAEGRGKIKYNWLSTVTLDTLLDEFFEIDRPLLESARRALLAENTGWTQPAFEPKEITP